MKTNLETSEKFNAVVDAVSYWLGYQFKIGREQLIHEASLRYPIADALTAKGIGISRIVLEKLHPIFRSKIIDLVVFDKHIHNPEAEEDDINLKEVFEFKLAKNETSKEYGEEHQRVFDDIARLAYYHLWGSKDCYFLMCGKYGDFKTYFVGQKNNVELKGNKETFPLRQNKPASLFDEWKPDGLYNDWFSFNIGEEKEKEFNETDHDSWGLKSFQSRYDVRDNTNHKYSPTITVKTKCIAITPEGLENKRTHAAGIWKIEAVSTN